MSIRVKSFLKDVGGAGRVTEARREKLKNASAVPDPKDPIRDLAGKLHPSEMQLRVTDIRDASPTAKTFRFEAADGHIPVFQCGQFVNFRLKIGESLLTRPYTISSAPYEARGEHGFGYDPLFYPDELGGLSLAEVPGEDKNAISHRGNALRALKAKLDE